MKPEREASIVVFWTTLLIIHGLMALALLGAIITRPLRSGGRARWGSRSEGAISSATSTK